jgi:excinuclease ABC subunit C
VPELSLPTELQEKLKKLPTTPGCYIYRDVKGDVLYVGKAINLRNRVRSYFQKSTNHGLRIARMVSKVHDLETITVSSEIEALVLENTLIKRYRPPFNVLLRDDKSYPYITITNETFPRVLFTRRVRKDHAKYFGPFTSAMQVRETLQLLHKLFPLIPCGKSWSGRAEQRPCLYYHLGQCLGPCAGLADKTEYAKVVGKVERFLSGKEEGLLDDLKREMAVASEALDYERAAKLRDQAMALAHVLQRQRVVSAEGGDQDVIAVVKDDRGAAILMLYIRGGKLIGQRQFMLNHTQDVAPGLAVQEFVKQYYTDAPEVPREVLLPVEIDEQNIVQTWLRQRKGSAVTVEVPQGGEKLKLVDLAAANAEQALTQFAQELEQKEVWGASAMEQLQEALCLPEPPIRVEGYDISNLQGMAPVGSMVVTENAEAARNEYRRFKIRFHPESPNDFAMMHEVLTRRLRAYLDGDLKFANLPNLIMIDGGKGQLSAALKARDDLGLTVPMVGLAKRHELIYVPIEAPLVDAPIDREVAYEYNLSKARNYTYREVELPLNSPGLMLLRKLRDEAHRFALTYHKKLRDKRTVGSTLEEVPGVGPKRKRLLLRTFGSVEGVRRASVEELAAVPTMTKSMAERVREYLHEG